MALVRTHTGAGPMMPAPVPHDRKFVVALARGLEVLRAFRPHDGMLGNTEIAERTGLPKPTVSRLTYTLTTLGYLKHLPRFSKYALAPGVLGLGYSALAQMGIRQIARPFMQDLADHAGASVALGAPDRLRVIYVEHCFSRSAVSIRLEVGSRIPIATTASGRALIAAMDARERITLLDGLAEHYGSRWPGLKAGIDQGIADYERYGFTLSIGDWQPDVNAVSAPLALPDGSGLFAINCGAPAYSLTREALIGDIGPRLHETVRRISAILTGQAGDPGTPPIAAIPGDNRQQNDTKWGGRRDTGGGGRRPVRARGA